MKRPPRSQPCRSVSSAGFTFGLIPPHISYISRHVLLVFFSSNPNNPQYRPQCTQQRKKWTATMLGRVHKKATAAGRAGGMSLSECSHLSDKLSFFCPSCSSSRKAKSQTRAVVVVLGVDYICADTQSPMRWPTLDQGQKGVCSSQEKEKRHHAAHAGAGATPYRFAAQRHHFVNHRRAAEVLIR